MRIKDIMEYFNLQIKNELKGLSHKKIVFFSWLCGVRALPFLNQFGEIRCWRTESKVINLYHILYALDTAYSYACDATDVSTATTAAAAIAADAASASAATSVYYSASATYAASATASAATSAASTAASAAYYAASAAKEYKIDLSNILLDDIKYIKDNIYSHFNNDIYLYGSVWEYFQNALNKLDCGYWGNLYSRIFESGFKQNKEELKRRVNIPVEIREQGAAAVATYLQQLESHGSEYLNESRIIILGEKGAGKTSIALKLVDINAEMPKEDESTEGVSVFMWKVHDEQTDGTMNVHIWDFAGHVITHSAHRCFMSSRCLYIYVYNGRVEHDNRPDYWLEQIRIYGGDSPILFLINETDKHMSDIAKKTLKDDYPSIVDYYSVDIGNKNTVKLDYFREKVIELVRNNPSWSRLEISTNDYRVKEDLYTYFKLNETDAITREVFNNIASKNGVLSNDWERVLNNLHTLGICLWYNNEDMEDFNTLVLNPDWITSGIYKIINWGFNNDKHVLSVDDNEQIFIDQILKNRYPRNKVQFLFKLMRVYELAFFKTAKKILIPSILPIDRPDDLPNFLDNDRLTMSFVVDKALPPNITSRVIVRRHEDIDDDKKLWRKGAVLHYREGDATALIIEDARSIVVRVNGKDQTQYIESLRDTLKDIFESYKGIQPDLRYEVLLPENLRGNILPFSLMRNNEPTMLSESTICAHIEKQLPYLEPIRKVLLPLNETALAYGVANVFINSKIIGTLNDYSIHTEIHDCVINFQGEMYNLERDLKKQGYDADADYIGEVVEAIEEMQGVIDTVPEKKDIAQVLTKKGIISKLKGFYEDITDENSDLYKNTVKLRNGTKKVQKMLKVYNEVAKLVPVLPQVPDVLLNIGQ